MLIKIYYNNIENHASDVPMLFRPTTFPVTFGRSEDNAIVFTNDSVSSHHAQIEKREDGYYLVDLQSTNGIFFEKKKVTELKIEGQHHFHLGEIQIEVSLQETAHEKTRVIHLESHLENENKKVGEHQRYYGLYAILIVIYSLLVLDKFLEEPLTARAFATSLGYLCLIFLAFVLFSLITSFPRVKQFYFTHLIILLKSFSIYFSLGILIYLFAFFIPSFTNYQDLLTGLGGFAYLGAAFVILKREWGFSTPFKRAISAFSILVIPVVIVLGMSFSERNEGYSESESLVVGYPWATPTNYPSAEVLNSEIDKAIIALDKIKDDDK